MIRTRKKNHITKTGVLSLNGWSSGLFGLICIIHTLQIKLNHLGNGWPMKPFICTLQVP